ncbi:MAG: hypothetical protein ACT4PU_07810 [Planctomycetota bacterium]
MRESKVTLKIPRPLYERIQEVIADSGFSSPTDFIVFVLRDLVGDRALQKSPQAASNAADSSANSAARPAALNAADSSAGVSETSSNDEINEIRRKLRNLGYL